MKYIRLKKEQGFTLFVALIVTSLLLAITFSLSDIILKQLIFSQSAKESQISFYAADSGAECALFWDRKNEFGSTTPFGAFATSTEPDAGNVNGNGVYYNLYCGNGGSDNSVNSFGKVGGFTKELQNGGLGSNVYSATTTFYVDFQDTVTGSSVIGQKTACAKVTVAKSIDNSDPSFPVEHTTIDSRGYDAPLEGTVGLLGINQTLPWGDAICKITSDRVIERAMRIDY